MWGFFDRVTYRDFDTNPLYKKAYFKLPPAQQEQVRREGKIRTGILNITHGIFILIILFGPFFLYWLLYGEQIIDSVPYFFNFAAFYFFKFSSIWFLLYYVFTRPVLYTRMAIRKIEEPRTLPFAFLISLFFTCLMTTYFWSYGDAECPFYSMGGHPIHFEVCAQLAKDGRSEMFEDRFFYIMYNDWFENPIRLALHFGAFAGTFSDSLRGVLFKIEHQDGLVDRQQKKIEDAVEFSIGDKKQAYGPKRYKATLHSDRFYQYMYEEDEEEAKYEELRKYAIERKKFLDRDKEKKQKELLKEETPKSKISFSIFDTNPTFIQKEDPKGPIVMGDGLQEDKEEQELKEGPTVIEDSLKEEEELNPESPLSLEPLVEIPPERRKLKPEEKTKIRYVTPKLELRFTRRKLGPRIQPEEFEAWYIRFHGKKTFGGDYWLNYDNFISSMGARIKFLILYLVVSFILIVLGTCFFLWWQGNYFATEYQLGEYLEIFGYRVYTPGEDVYIAWVEGLRTFGVEYQRPVPTDHSYPAPFPKKNW